MYRRCQMARIIRLADAIAGASAQVLKYQETELSELFSQARQSGTIVEV